MFALVKVDKNVYMHKCMYYVKKDGVNFGLYTKYIYIKFYKMYKFT